MQSKFFYVFAICLSAACSQPASTGDASEKKGSPDVTTPASAVSYAYPIGYSADFEIGDAKYAGIVTSLWKDYDENNFDRHKDVFADSVAMDFADGSSFHGTKDSLMSSVKQQRSAVATSVSKVEALTTLKAKGKDETWVCIWGTAINTDSKGNTDSLFVNENWMFNKDGKVAYMTQYTQRPPTANK